MLIFDNRAVGNRLLALRKRKGLTQTELAYIAGISDRTYADIERGSTNMRIETALRICQALSVTPDEIFTETPDTPLAAQEEILSRLEQCTDKERGTVLRIISAYLESL